MLMKIRDRKEMFPKLLLHPHHKNPVESLSRMLVHKKT